MKPYTLTLTASDLRTIAFVGERYGWSSALRDCTEGTNEFTESEAWDILDSAKSDTDGGHMLFPMLSAQSDLFWKLVRFLDTIV